VVDVVEEEARDRDHELVLVARGAGVDDAVAVQRGVLVDEREGDELRDRAGAVLQVADHAEVLRAVRDRLHVAVHHRRGDVEAGRGRPLHRRDPVVGADLPRADHVADLVDEYLRGGAGRGVEPGGRQLSVDAFVRPVGAAGGVVRLLGRHRVEVDPADGHRLDLFGVGPRVGGVPLGRLVVHRALGVVVRGEDLVVLLVQRQGGVEPGDGTHLVDPHVEGVLDDASGLRGGLREPGVVRVAVGLERVRRVLEVTEQTARVAGGRDVVVEVGDERHLVADRLASAPVGGLEDGLLPDRVDPVGVRAGREEFGRVVDGEPNAVAGLRQRVLERLVGGRLGEAEVVPVERLRVGGVSVGIRRRSHPVIVPAPRIKTGR